jgi:hypothetical protein
MRLPHHCCRPATAPARRHAPAAGASFARPPPLALPTGVPAAQQALMFGGRELQEGGALLEDLRLDSYSTRQEVRAPRRAAPRRLWLSRGRARQSRQTPARPSPDARCPAPPRQRSSCAAGWQRPAACGSPRAARPVAHGGSTWRRSSWGGRSPTWRVCWRSGASRRRRLPSATARGPAGPAVSLSAAGTAARRGSRWGRRRRWRS